MKKVLWAFCKASFDNLNILPFCPGSITLIIYLFIIPPLALVIVLWVMLLMTTECPMSPPTFVFTEIRTPGLKLFSISDRLDPFLITEVRLISVANIFQPLLSPIGSEQPQNRFNNVKRFGRYTLCFRNITTVFGICKIYNPSNRLGISFSL